MVDEKTVKVKAEKLGWGVENLPYPRGAAFIQSRDDLCVGCGICEMACSIYHFGMINRELSRIRILKYLTPLSKAIQSICVQCGDQRERECEKTCPLDPPAIYLDKQTLSMKVDAERCLGHNCGKCREACTAEIPRFYPPQHDYALVCDLCEKNGERKPQCVEVCPTYALEYMPERGRFEASQAHWWRIHPDEKADLISKRLHPLKKDTVGHW
jgi:Fe-S-cluster-containing hydrogenase component 2